MDLPTFRTTFPEFASAKDPLIESFLALAATRTDASVWGNLYDQGHGYLTAHLLATSPNGQFARLEVKGMAPGRSLYADQREQLERMCTVGLRST